MDGGSPEGPFTLTRRESSLTSPDPFYLYGASPKRISSGGTVKPALPSSLEPNLEAMSLMSSAKVNDESRMRALEPDQVGDILGHHLEALVLFHAALEMHRVSTRVLSEVRRSRDALFGEGIWIIHHLGDLNEAQRLAADKAMVNWDLGAQIHKKSPYS